MSVERRDVIEDETLVRHVRPWAQLLLAMYLKECVVSLTRRWSCSGRLQATAGDTNMVYLGEIYSMKGSVSFLCCASGDSNIGNHFTIYLCEKNCFLKWLTPPIATVVRSFSSTSEYLNCPLTRVPYMPSPCWHVLVSVYSTRNTNPKEVAIGKNVTQSFLTYMVLEATATFLYSAFNNHVRDVSAPAETHA